ncbi:hypothetical protein GCM10022278_14490 [Allohahella marinimesophila]|uniref:Uncharacterized protein n=1 Tax=Allohahella marinimesophila TaxID=1054972 RepID=A0ABP7NZC3_9GAMM
MDLCAVAAGHASDVHALVTVLRRNLIGAVGNGMGGQWQGSAQEKGAYAE